MVKAVNFNIIMVKSIFLRILSVFLVIIAVSVFGLVVQVSAMINNNTKSPTKPVSSLVKKSPENERKISTEVSKKQKSAVKSPLQKTINKKKTTSKVVDNKNYSLSTDAIINITNANRTKINNVPFLEENYILNQIAQRRLNDMFENQYFAHKSPAGVGPADVAKLAGYDYVILGENIAMGEYKNELDLVEAWMNSPGHRKNILNPTFKEIGVAVRKGLYKGNEVWLAVQVFGSVRSTVSSQI